MVLNFGCACILNLELVYKAQRYEAVPSEDFSQCSASPKFSSKKEKCPFGTHCGIAWGCLLVFLCNARMLLWSAHTFPYFAWDRLNYFSFLLMSSPFSVTEDYFPSFFFLNSWSSLIKRKKKLKGHFKFRNIPKHRPESSQYCVLEYPEDRTRGTRVVRNSMEVLKKLTWLLSAS